MPSSRRQWIALTTTLFSVASCAIGQTVTIFGLDHSSIGSGALVSLGGQLEVFTAGIPSGGVSIDVTSVEAAQGSFSGLNPASITTGGWSYEVLAGGSPLSNFSVTPVGSSWDFNASFLTATGPITVEAYVGETLVSSATIVSGTLGNILASSWEVDYLRDAGTHLEKELRFPSGANIMLTGQATVTADRLLIVSGPPIGPLGNYDTVNVVTNLGVFFVDGAGISVFGHLHESLGNATMSATGSCPSCVLTLGNIGSSGSDGVRTFLVDADGFSARLGVIGPFSGLGQTLKVSARGTVDQMPDEDIGSIEVEDIGSSLEIRSEFFGLGATRRTIEVYENGSLKGSVSGISGLTTASLPDTAWPVQYGISARRVPSLLPAFEMSFRNPTSFTLPGGGGIAVGDLIVVIADNAISDIKDITTVDNEQGDLPGLDVVQEDDDPFCQGDFNNSNSVDLTDLGVLLSNFGEIGSGISDGDANGDTFITLSDLATVLAAFGSNCAN